MAEQVAIRSDRMGGAADDKSNLENGLWMGLDEGQKGILIISTSSNPGSSPGSAIVSGKFLFLSQSHFFIHKTGVQIAPTIRAAASEISHARDFNTMPDSE